MVDRLRLSLALVSTALLPLLPHAQEEASEPAGALDPITEALVADSALAEYNEHLVFLSSPFLDGRLPGTRGMEIAKDYVEHWFAEHGLQPGFMDETGLPTFRQDFKLASRATLKSQSFEVVGSDASFEANVDYGATRLGHGGSFEGKAVFVGYSIGNGPQDYTNYPEGLDLSGKVAVMLRFEPMEADGSSQWSDSGWSRRAQFASKMRAAKNNGAEAVVLINTPGADDPRIEQLIGFSGMSPGIDGPAVGISVDAGARLCEALGASIEDLKRRADTEGGYVELDGTIKMSVEVDEQAVTAQNIGGLVPGKGELANELIVIGGHLDHLGMGFFGSRGESGKLHPGADDNASGAAALILLGDRLKRKVDALPEGASARSVLLVAFSAEESGLNGSRYYVDNPPRPLDDHALMINFDMIGRIENNRLAVTGVETAVGLAELVQPHFDASPLEVVTSRRGGGGSDHLPFLQNEVPALFAILADIRQHPDYHTPGDTSDKINRVAAMQTVDMFEDIAWSAATHAGSLEWKTDDEEATAASAPREPRVRLGITAATTEGEGLGILIGSVTEGTSAAEAGMQAGDLMMRWNGAKIDDLASWMQTLVEHEPGDEVKVGVKRDGEEITLTVKLQAR